MVDNPPPDKDNSIVPFNNSGPPSKSGPGYFGRPAEHSLNARGVSTKEDKEPKTVNANYRIIEEKYRIPNEQIRNNQHNTAREKYVKEKFDEEKSEAVRQKRAEAVKHTAETAKAAVKALSSFMSSNNVSVPPVPDLGVSETEETIGQVPNANAIIYAFKNKAALVSYMNSLRHQVDQIHEMNTQAMMKSRMAISSYEKMISDLRKQEAQVPRLVQDKFVLSMDTDQIDSYVKAIRNEIENKINSAREMQNLTRRNTAIATKYYTNLANDYSKLVSELRRYVHKS